MRTLRTTIFSGALLTGFVLVNAAAANSSFDVRITITSECNTQQPLFGPNAQHLARVNCEPDITPYQAHAIILGTDDEPQTQAGNTQEHAKPYGAAAFRPFKKEALFPPLLHKSASVSRVFYVIF